MRPYGCRDRAPLEPHAVVQDGWLEQDGGGYWTRMPVLVQIPDPMTKDCQYSKTHQDPRCEGCKHKNVLA